MKSRLALTWLVVLAVVAISALIWTNTKKEAAPESGVNTANRNSPGSAGTLSNRPTNAAGATPATAPTTPTNPSVAPIVKQPPVLASTVVAGAPMARSGANSPRPTNIAPATIPPQRVSNPEARADIQNIGLMFRDFRTRLGENPVGSNQEIMKAVMGGNRAQVTVGPPQGQTLNDRGELVDRWGTPYFFHQLSKNNMEIRSAGPDRIMWTSDDVVGR